ncbi:hypothetical protein [Malacoplasma muris]|uniref:sensor histidine kinase n=1 Tax=Malacoplasma muris TaxID=2119 RepID=UPI00398E7FE2
MYRKQRGELRIFFGYSAGVGKTYSMLQKAHQLKKEGFDVIVGYYEPHQRPDTAKLLKGLETLKLKKITYKGKKFNEFNIDEALKRRSEIILIDELAHTNVPGSRNDKRYLDVLELLNAGINVITTLNVQHIESINDLIKDKIQSKVYETVPDSIFDDKTKIELIDIDPEDLIERLKDGKIYPKSKIDLSLTNFFTIKNLSYLREISMVQSIEKIQKEENNNKVKSEIMVLITGSPSSEKNIRIASRMAANNYSHFTALYVEQFSDREKDKKTLEKNINLVERLGGQMVIMHGDNVAEIVANYVKINKITNIVIGKSWSRSLKKGIENQIISLLPEIQISIIPYTKSKVITKRTQINFSRWLKFDWISTIKLVVLIPLLCILFFFLKSNYFNVLCVLFYLTSMLIISYKSKNPLYSILMALAGSLGYIFIAQIILDAWYMALNFFILFFMGIFYSAFVIHYIRIINKSEKNNHTISSMVLLSSNLANQNNNSKKCEVIVQTVGKLLKRSCMLYISSDSKSKKFIAKLQKNKETPFDDENEKIIIEWTVKNNKPSGKNTQTLISSKCHYEPIELHDGSICVFGIDCSEVNLDYSDIVLLKTLLPIIKISID